MICLVIGNAINNAISNQQDISITKSFCIPVCAWEEYISLSSSYHSKDTRTARLFYFKVIMNNLSLQSHLGISHSFVGILDISVQFKRLSCIMSRVITFLTLSDS